MHLAKRLQRIIYELFDLSAPVGSLDINLYRDDWTKLHVQPLVRSTDFPFAIDDKEVILVDDVLYTGRTVRAALDALADYGRPQKVQLAVMVDRGHRELPICAQFIGKQVATDLQEHVNVYLSEKSGFDQVAFQSSSLSPRSGKQ